MVRVAQSTSRAIGATFHQSRTPPDWQNLCAGVKSVDQHLVVFRAVRASARVLAPMSVKAQPLASSSLRSPFAFRILNAPAASTSQVSLSFMSGPYGAREGPKVCGLSAGGRWIRTLGSWREGAGFCCGRRIAGIAVTGSSERRRPSTQIFEADRLMPTSRPMRMARTTISDASFSLKGPERVPLRQRFGQQINCPEGRLRAVSTEDRSGTGSRSRDRGPCLPRPC